MKEKLISLIFGKRGSGKTYLATHLTQTEHRLIVFDTLGEYTNGVIFDDLKDLAEFWLNRARGNFRLVYRPLQPEADFEKICCWIWLCGNLTLLVEEIDTFGSPQKIGRYFAHIVQRGRHRNITLIGITQRPYGIHRLLTSQAKEICVFSTNEPRDLDYLRDLLGGNEIENLIKGLNQFEFVRWREGELKVCKAGTNEIHRDKIRSHHFGR
jgi:hypothetical protein